MSAKRADVAARIPDYLVDTYEWAYVTPRAVRMFERQWLVNLILWGNFARLREAALDALGTHLTGKTLQVACVYGDLTPRLLARHAPDGQLDVLDILPAQIDNLRRKMGPHASRIGIHHENSAAMPYPDASYDRALLFFLLHEQPESVRRKTLAEALRVVRPGGKVVLIDYHRPSRWHPLRGLMHLILSRLEPYALDLWAHEIDSWLPPGFAAAGWTQRTYFGALYQRIEITLPTPPSATH